MRETAFVFSFSFLFERKLFHQIGMVNKKSRMKHTNFNCDIFIQDRKKKSVRE